MNQDHIKAGDSHVNSPSTRGSSDWSPICSSQWTMEQTIGSLGQEIHQPSNPFANLSQQALQHCQVNALKAMIPDLEKSAPTVPQGGQYLGGGYILLWVKDRASRAM